MTPPLPGHALVIDLAKIPIHGLALDTEIAPASLHLPQDESFTVTAPIRVQGLLTKVMEQVYFQGQICGTLTVPCSRCLELVSDDFVVDVRVVFLFAASYGSSDEERWDSFADDLDVYAHDGIRMDLQPLVRDQVVLAFPAQTLCREDCAGLCQVCGANRNEQPCACQVENTDSRFAILKRLNLPSS